jgi:hypothetical protein
MRLSSSNKLMTILTKIKKEALMNFDNQLKNLRKKILYMNTGHL